MAYPTTPHTESGQNQRMDPSDTEPGVPLDTVGTPDDPEPAPLADGAQTGMERNPVVTGTSSAQHTIPNPSNTFEGNTTTRTPEGSGQGISSHSVSEESERQKKVVPSRPDAQSGVTQK